MPPRDIYYRDDERETGPPGHQAEDHHAFDPDLAQELEIEKKWLLTARIDPEQFTFFFDKYHDRIYSYAFWVLGNADDAADLTNQTFTLAWQKLGRFRWQGYTFGAWLFQLARNEIRNHQRRESYRQTEEYFEDTDSRVVSENPEVVLASKTEQQVLRVCLARLHPVRYEVFVLFYWVGLDAHQIATVTKMAHSTVRSHLKRGREQLVQYLKEHEKQLGPQWRKAMQEQLMAHSKLRLLDHDGNDPRGQEGDGAI